MKGEAVITIQLAALETSDPRLLPENRIQNSLDRSFDEKLKDEQARLGLLFSPFAQLNSLLAASSLEFAFLKTEPSASTGQGTNYFQPNQPEKTFVAPDTPHPSRPTPQLFESISLRPLNKQLFQELLNRTSFLVPNLSAQPLFSQAFLEGRFQPKLDLQFLIDQIIEQVKLVKGKGRTELSLTLKPEDLGEIFLQLTSLAGKVSIFIAASPETKKLIDASKEELERALKKVRVNLGDLKIEEAKKHA